MKQIDFNYFFKHNALLLRRNANLKQRELADKLNMTRNTVGAIEEGRALSLNSLYAYSEYFKVEMKVLITAQLTKADLESKNPE